MTHLTPQQFVDAIDGALSPVHATHVKSCEACRQEISSLRSLAGDARGVGAPEPSPLFWEHLSERVRAATSVEPVPVEAWWRGVWNPAVAIGMAVALMAFVFVVRSGPMVQPVPVDELAQAESLAAGVDDDSLAFVARVASTLDAEDLHQIAQPTADSIDAALNQLSAEQRETLVQLLKTKIGRGE